MSFSFPPKKRIRKRADYLRIQKRSKKISTKYFTVSYCFKPNSFIEDEKIVPRLGIVATKKIGNAVVRNRSKRLIRETFRRHQNLLPFNIEVVFLLNKNIVNATQQILDAEFTAIIRKNFAGDNHGKT